MQWLWSSYVQISHHFYSFHQTRLDESKQFISMGLVAAVQKADRRLTLIPVVFILLRIWGTIQFFYSIIVTRSIPNYNECVSNGVSVGFLILGYLQVCKSWDASMKGWEQIAHKFASVRTHLMHLTIM